MHVGCNSIDKLNCFFQLHVEQYAFIESKYHDNSDIPIVAVVQCWIVFVQCEHFYNNFKMII